MLPTHSSGETKQRDEDVSGAYMARQLVRSWGMLMRNGTLHIMWGSGMLAVREAHVLSVKAVQD